MTRSLRHIIWAHAYDSEGRWGKAGSGILLTCERQVLLFLRSRNVTEGGTWGVPGGAVDPGEDPHQSALRELQEEGGLHITSPPLGKVTLTSGTFTYTTFVHRMPTPVTPHLNWESDEARWVDLDAVEAMHLHPGLRKAWPKLRALVG